LDFLDNRLTVCLQQPDETKCEGRPINEAMDQVVEEIDGMDCQQLKENFAGKSEEKLRFDLED
jgi:hypothetical protein